MLSLVFCIFFQLTIHAQTSKSEKQLRQEILQKAKQTSEYKDIYTQIRTLQTNVSLAKEGLISKLQLLNHYNNGLGQSMGKAKDFKSLNKIVADKSNSFLTMRLYQIAAKVALENAAEKDNSVNR